MRNKALLCGEGPTDYGMKKYGADQWQAGPVQSFIRKTATKPVIFEHVEKDEIKRLRIQRGPKSGHSVKSYKLCVLAGKRKINTVICYADADKIPGKGKKEIIARQSFYSVYNEIQKGFELFNTNFGNGNRGKIYGIPMVPLRMIESWLLSDERAYKKCFGKVPSNPSLPAEPELIWGRKEDPRSDYPKNVLMRVLKQYEGKEGNRETYREIAEEIDIKVLRERCPISFETFYKDIRENL